MEHTKMIVSVMMAIQVVFLLFGVFCLVLKHGNRKASWLLIIINAIFIPVNVLTLLK